MNTHRLGGGEVRRCYYDSNDATVNLGSVFLVFGPSGSHLP